MNVRITEDERSIATKAVELAGKKLEQLRKLQDEFFIEDLAVQALQGHVETFARDLRDMKQKEFGWLAPDRRALILFLRVYRGKLLKVAESQESLLVEPEDTRERVAALNFFAHKLDGQESLWRFNDDVIDAETDDADETDDLWDATSAEEKVAQHVEEQAAHDAPLDLPCPDCGAPADQPCRTGSGVERVPHRTREKAAEKAAKQRAKLAGV